MSVKVIILGLLRKGPLHGYELKRIVERDMGDWTDIAFGSIYFALDKLAKDDLVTAHTEAGEHNRPARIVYSITPAGEAAYLSLLREVFTVPLKRNNSLDIGIAFHQDLPLAEIREYLAERAAQLEKRLEHLATHETETMKITGIPAHSRLIFSHARHQLQAELDWTREVLDSL